MSREVEARPLAALVHGRYLYRAAADGAGDDAPLLVGFHGYGENAERHLEALEGIPGVEGWQLCAVQGLHRFYNQKTGEVLASWMTRQDRELAIGDNVRYAAAAVGEVVRRGGRPRRLVYAGFSQGVAMAYRAAAQAGWKCHGILALAGDVPPDVAGGDPPALPPILLGRGRADAWYNARKMDDDLRALEALGARVETCVFDGGHEWSPEYYRAAGDFLERTLNGEG